MTERVVEIHPKKPQKDRIDEAVQIIKNGGVIAFPTRSLYGLGVDALNPKAVKKIFEIKKRPADKPILVLVKNIEAIKDIVEYIPPSALQMMDAFWPGNVTIVLKATSVLPEELTAGTGKIGVRIPQHPVASALVNAFDGLITGTSANVSGEQGCSDISDLDPVLTSMLDLILDAGALKEGKGSTIVDATVHPPEMLREGEILAAEISGLFNIS